MSPLVYSSSAAAASSISLSQKILISSKLHNFILLYNHHSHSHSHYPISSLLKSHPSPSPSPPPFPNHQNFNNTHNNNNKPLIFPQKMATCVDTSRAEPTKPCDPDRSKSDHHRYKYANYCRPSFSDLVSCVPNSQNHQKPTNLIRNVEDYEDDLWSKMVEEAKSDVDQEPILSNYYYNSILSHKCLESALSNHLASKLCSTSLNSNTLFDLFKGVLVDNKDLINEVKSDLRAVRERDPACISYVHCFLNFKGFLACQSHRIAHKLWSQGRKILALLVQNRVSEVFAVDIHPGAKIGKGILLDHATGLVIGETAVIGNNVSILHNVTLGGTGKMCGDRHAKIGDGVLIGAGTCVLGNVKIGDGAKIGAGSVVLKDVPPRTTAVGNPARLVGGVQNPTRLDKIPSFTMDHTSHINGWSDYVI